MRDLLVKTVAIAAVAVIGATALFNPVVGFAQADKMLRPTPEATIYRDVSYQGPAVAIGENNPNLGLAWPINSIRVAAGSWQLCERPNYGAPCLTVDRDQAMLGTLQRGMSVQSIRLIGSAGGGGGFIGVEAKNQVTRGAYSEYHTQPEVRGYRIPACSIGRLTASCAKRTADNYCRTRGWNGSAYRAQQPVGQRVFLADVLCVRSGF